MLIEFQKLSEEAKEPTRAYEHDAGYDLFAVEAAVLEPGKRASIGTGIAVAVPQGHAGLVLPRSGLAAKYGVTLVNAPGLIDPGYRGEVRVLLLNTDGEQSFRINRGDRIAQLVLVAVATLDFRERQKLDTTQRARGGFGSTGS